MSEVDHSALGVVGLTRVETDYWTIVVFSLKFEVTLLNLQAKVSIFIFKIASITIKIEPFIITI